jgi:hypothetical protein
MGGPVFNQSVEGVDLDEPRKGYGVGGFSARAGGRGVFGQSEEGIGVHGDSDDKIGVRGRGGEVGVEGVSEEGIGVYGTSSISYGVYGRSDTRYGVYGYSNNYYGVVGHSRDYPGVYGYSDTSPGVVGRSNISWGMFGFSDRGDGVYGYSNISYGVSAYSNTSYGLYASSNTGLAAYLEGRVDMTSDVNMSGPVSITGPLTKPAGSFKIDHPLDPANKYLYHSFVESPDMKNVYDGVVVLDDKGEAEIELPDWFGALNKDFRYQLTAIGAPGPNLHISEEISDATTTNYSRTRSNNNKNNNNSSSSRFKVAGGASGMKVSWQVTGIRKDPWANAHRISVEEDKPDKERGYYTYPELYGQPEEKRISRLLFPRDEEEEEKQELPLINK